MTLSKNPRKGDLVYISTTTSSALLCAITSIDGPVAHLRITNTNMSCQVFLDDCYNSYFEAKQGLNYARVNYLVSQIKSKEDVLRFPLKHDVGFNTVNNCFRDADAREAYKRILTEWFSLEPEMDEFDGTPCR